MARAHYIRYILDDEGRAISGASVEVRQPGTSTLIVDTIWDADTGGSSQGNPFVARSDGKCEIYLDAAQRVDLYITKTGYDPQTVTADVVVLTASTLIFQDETINLTQRAKINFTGDSVVATDAGAGPNRTDVTINHLGTAVHSAAQPAQAHALSSGTHTGALAAGQHGDRSAEGGTQHAHGQLNGVGATDHHAAPVAGPDADITVDVAGAAGTAGAFARSTHGHKVPTDATAPTRVQKTASAGPGATGAIARSQHIHRGTVEATNQAFGGPSSGTSQVSLLDAAYVIAANSVTAGQTYRVKILATINLSGSQTMTIRFKVGGSTLRTITFNVTLSGAVLIEATVRFTTPGAGGSAKSGMVAVGVGYGSDADVSGTALDTTTNLNLDVSAQPSLNGDTCRSVSATVEILEP